MAKANRTATAPRAKPSTEPCFYGSWEGGIGRYVITDAGGKLWHLDANEGKVAPVALVYPPAPPK